VNVRKGIGYLLEAARLLEGEPVEFVVAGPLQIRKEVVTNAAKNIRWLGPVPRSEASEMYAQSDIFVLPTLSDGFAITQLEALAHGCPVITTLNCGRVVLDGITGFTVPPRDASALSKALQTFITDRSLAIEMAVACKRSIKAFSIEDYGRRLIELCNGYRETVAHANAVKEL
jgi:glycosyltransferase involved in cell wall biosynthesis